MESDKHFYEIFEINPQWIFELTERPSPGPCKFFSLTLKAIERRSDGVLIPDADDQPISVTEFQMQPDEDIYNRIVIEMAILKGQRPDRQVDGLIIFASRELDSQTEPWRDVVSTYYLDEMLEHLSQKSPAHPLVAVFQPLVEPNRDLLESRAETYYNQIKLNTPDQRQQEKLLSVFWNWYLQRFHERGLQEIDTMLLGKLPSLRETQAGKDLIAIGLEQGVEKGSLIGTILTCQRVLGLEPANALDLREKSMEELSQMADELQSMIRK